ncbi:MULTISPECIES: hypothetical protein [unclassified Microbacterium]|uniref:hypothetical protein n=1 Tax=unclassified Microbacterium TaxID=2609290 RepID=UPI00214AF38C|nr:MULTISPECIES: hypothetical protein [unclassified Microbacterium]MCR2809941.1 hypothetical protein [Microbacterium sp. zg.B185]WIM17754.1 hypothetical protein QNO12_08960 [Microbacterium sp. zg-B185]
MPAALTGCSIDSVIWGWDGARVIQITEEIVDAMADRNPTDLICADSAAELGEPTDWLGLSAGEPERFFADHWDEQVPLDPQWNINLEGLPEGLTPGSTFPGDVFYRETDDGLCVIDIAWSTLVTEG